MESFFRGKALALITVVCALAVRSAHSAALDHWHARNSPPAGDPYAVAYGNNTFVAGGFAGTMATSPDGIHWTLREAPVAGADIYGVAFGNGVFVAAAYDRDIVSSVNGFEWILRSTNFGAYEALAFAGGKFFAMGYRLAVSTDGTNWAFPSLGTSFNFYDLTFGKNLYAAVNYDSRIATSYDGLTWMLHATAAGDLNSIAFGNDRFVAAGYGGEVITSVDGTNWTIVASGIEEDIRKVSFLQGRFFAVGGSYGPGAFVAVGEGTVWRGQKMESIGQQSLPKLRLGCNRSLSAKGFRLPWVGPIRTWFLLMV